MVVYIYVTAQLLRGLLRGTSCDHLTVSSILGAQLRDDCLFEVIHFDVIVNNPVNGGGDDVYVDDDVIWGAVATRKLVGPDE